MPNGGKNGTNRSTAGGSSGGIRRDNKNTTINCSSGIGGTRFMWYPGQGGGGSINIFSKNPEQVYENFSFVTMNEASKNLKGSLGSCEASVTCGIISSIGYTNIFNNY